MPPWARYSLIVAAVAIAGGGLTYWATRTPQPMPTTPIAEQWIQAVRQFGLEPVYPPQEDFLVGDIIAVISDDAAHDLSKSPLPTRALKLDHVDLTKALDEAYSVTYRFPGSKARPAGDGAIWETQTTNESVFKIANGPRTSLPVALLPSFSVRAERLADSAGCLPALRSASMLKARASSN